MMKKIKFLIPLLFMLFLCVKSSTQEKADSVNKIHFKYGLGLGIGSTTGYGLSFRYIPNKFGAQISFAPFKDNYSTQISLGITFLFNLIETDKTKFFIYEGNAYSYNKYQNESYFVGSNNSSYWNNGIGIGIEFIILKRVGFNIMGGYGGYHNFTSINITGETGLYFKF